jgi:hypothetical protein
VKSKVTCQLAIVYQKMLVLQQRIANQLLILRDLKQKTETTVTTKRKLDGEIEVAKKMKYKGDWSIPNIVRFTTSATQGTQWVPSLVRVRI